MKSLLHPYAKGGRSGQNHSPAEEQSRVWSEDSVQPDHYPAQTVAEPVGILVDVAARHPELPCFHRADDESSRRMWSIHQVDDRQIGYDEVRT
jgi:hypothetical protein